MKYLRLYVFFLVFVFQTFCLGQNKPLPQKENIKSETKVSTSRWLDNLYEYPDSKGANLIIQNSLPRGGPYTHPTGKRFGYGIFWSRIVNETASPAELTIDFPGDSFAIFPRPSSYLKLYLPPGTMTPEKESLHSYGSGIEAYLDTAFYKPTRVQRTIHPKEEYLFYTGMVFITPDNGPVRTGFVLKGQDLFYRINIAGQLDSALIPCGKIVFKK